MLMRTVADAQLADADALMLMPMPMRELNGNFHADAHSVRISTVPYDSSSSNPRCHIPTYRGWVNSCVYQ